MKWFFIILVVFLDGLYYFCPNENYFLRFLTKNFLLGYRFLEFSLRDRTKQGMCGVRGQETGETGIPD